LSGSNSRSVQLPLHIESEKGHEVVVDDCEEEVLDFLGEVDVGDGDDGNDDELPFDIEVEEPWEEDE